MTTTRDTLPSPLTDQSCATVADLVDVLGTLDGETANRLMAQSRRMLWDEPGETSDLDWGDPGEANDLNWDDPADDAHQHDKDARTTDASSTPRTARSTTNRSAPLSLAQRAALRSRSPQLLKIRRNGRRLARDTVSMRDAIDCGCSRIERAAHLLPTDLRDDYLVTMRDVLQTESATASSPMEVTRIAQRLVLDIVDVAYRNSTHQPERDIASPGRSLLKPISVAALMGAIAALSLLSNIIQVVELHPAGTILLVIILALIAGALGGATIERNRRRRLP